MTIARNFFLFFALALLGGGAIAAVYKSVDAEGNVVYTDEPGGSAKPVDLPPLSTIPPPALNRTTVTPAAENDNAASAGYQSLGIVTPTQDETLRDNTGNVAVSVAVQPALKKGAGHRFQYYLDGQSEGQPKISDRTVFQNLDRGAHTVAVAVVDASGKEIQRSSTVRFYLHRQSVNFPRGPGQPAPFRGN